MTKYVLKVYFYEGGWQYYQGVINNKAHVTHDLREAKIYDDAYSCRASGDWLVGEYGSISRYEVATVEM